ncbi:MAG: 2-C-methyl-D-erythritol 2,4-cyclodiphosphate synthase [Synergistaceae bacterium]|jgi:2-C-methyl-D-erythritol 4-phosphate cytidylyltransferase/2-C-methyl-D-erythritol 2,4-cyclodiphosphate synthase|nr:2-C-methyl-D-erythritol 2,4-cyclodiphosphate synthase [Synergistaceae bacterium]
MSGEFSGNFPRDFAFVIVAGGSGSRIGGLGKQFRALGGERKPAWRWSVDLALSAREWGVREIVLVLPRTGGAGAEGEGWGEFLSCPLSSCPLPVRIAAGGATRSDSVRSGLEAAGCRYVMVHDAARPFASASLLRRLAEETTPEIGAVPVLPVAEALKRIDGTGVHAVDREGLYVTQTPQSFFRETLIRVLGSESGAAPVFRDEAEAWLAAGLELRCVEGERLNFKVTWPEDLKLASLLAAERERGEAPERPGPGSIKIGEIRTGIGYDLHRLTPERRLVLGGVLVDSPLGLLGHSDADVLAHAVADALLGAAGLPDIGNLFPASDGRYKDADSMELLREAAALVRKEQWKIVWVDAVIEAQVPRLNGFLPAVRAKVDAVLNSGNPNSGSDSSGALCFNVKAKSPEKTGDPGAARAMVCRAVATLRREAE